MDEKKFLPALAAAILAAICFKKLVYMYVLIDRHLWMFIAPKLDKNVAMIQLKVI